MLQQLFELESRMPDWLRPTYRGALFIPGIASSLAGKLLFAAILALLGLMVGSGPALALFLGLLGVSIVAGAAAGTILGLLRPLETLSRAGAWLTWTLAIFGFVAAAVLLTPNGPFTLKEPTFYPFAATCSALAAALVVLLDDRRPGRPSPRQFERRQSRERLWASAARLRARMESRSELPALGSK